MWGGYVGRCGQRAGWRFFHPPILLRRLWPMLAFGMKVAPDKIPLVKPLKKLAEDQSAFIEDLAGWRDRMRMANFADKSGAECRDDMLSYYKLAMQADELFKGTGLAISFRWRDSFDKDVICSGTDFGYEAACALFNVAAATSFMATAEDRGSEEGMWKACTYFQEAAGLLDAVKQLVKGGAWPNLSPDLSINLLDALHFLMLAQAQKCFYEKATRAGMKDSIVAKIAAECAACNPLYPRLRRHAMCPGCDVMPSGALASTMTRASASVTPPSAAPAPGTGSRWSSGTGNSSKVCSTTTRPLGTRSSTSTASRCAAHGP